MVKECKTTIANTASDLDDRLHEIDNKLQTLIMKTDRSADMSAELQRHEEEKELTQQGLLICQQANDCLSQLRVNVFEEISAAQDAPQAIVSTFNDRISARRVTAGVGAT